MKGNKDGEKGTNFGALAAYEVPWAVIPNNFWKLHKPELSGNNIVAVIWYVGMHIVGFKGGKC